MSRQYGSLWQYREHMGNELNGWRDLVVLAVETALHEARPEMERRKDKILDMAEPLNATDKPAYLRLEEQVGSYAVDLMEAAALLGYAVARTWPTSAEEMDGWHKRAIALIGMQPEDLRETAEED